MKVTHLIDKKTLTSDSLIRRFAADVLAGLSGQPKHLPSKYFYDDHGSELFQQITQQPEYFVTRAEVRALESIEHILPAVLDQTELDIIELGPGNGGKAKLLIEGFLAAGTRINYYPVDISAKVMELIREHVPEREGLTIHGVVSEYIEGLRHIRKQSEHPILVLFLGSSIGNFLPAGQQEFLRMLGQALGTGDFLMVGFDLRKDMLVHNASFNDAAGVTAQFNLNLLRRVNRELGGDADLSTFRYYSYFNPVIGAMESYLISLVEQEVTVSRLEKTFSFHAFEPIHVEYSFKLLPTEIEELAQASGFAIHRNFCDPKGEFMDSLWQIRPEL